MLIIHINILMGVSISANPAFTITNITLIVNRLRKYQDFLYSG